jgi:hypothetical protein
MRLRALWFLLLALAVLPQREARAAFHFMKVVEVFPGTAADPNAQFIELQMWFDGQNLVSGHSTYVYDAANNIVGTFTFASNVANGASQSTILLATAQAQALFGLAPDLVMSSAPIATAGGKVCFDPSPLAPLECVAWGNYSGPATGVGTPFNVAGGLTLGQSIHRRLDIAGSPTLLENADDTDNSANDFVAGAPTPRNNAGQPAVTTLAATLVGAVGATLNATVNPNGGATMALFDYGTTTGYGISTMAQAVGSGSSAVSVNAAVSGLVCNTLYHFRGRASNAGGTTNGTDLTFTTSACPGRVFASVTGLDTNDCSNIATPCRTLNAAIGQVATDGEVIVIKSGSYAGATITKGVKLNAAAGVVAFSGQPITVNAPAATVVIRGLTLKAVTPGTGTGILVQAAGAVFVENSVVDGWAIGIQQAAPEAFIKESIFRNNDTGFYATAGKTTIDDSRFTNNNVGIASDIATVAVRGSTVSGNTTGIYDDSSSVMTVEKCQIANNGTGIKLPITSMSTLALSHSVVTGNGIGLDNVGGMFLYVYGNNAIQGNTTNTSGTITTLPLQ